MKQGMFVEGLSSQVRLLDGLERVKRRVTAETSIIVVQGEPGYGKTNTMQWLVMGAKAAEARKQRRRDEDEPNSKNAIYMLANPNWTTRWFLNEMAGELGLPKRRTTQEQHDEVVEFLGRFQPLIVIDEFEMIVGKQLLMHTIRRLKDVSECVVIFSGKEDGTKMLRTNKELSRRIFDVIRFGAATLADVEKLCATLSDVEIATDLCAKIADRTAGKMDDILFAISWVEAFAKKSRMTRIDAAKYENRPLLRTDVGRTNLMAVAHG